MTATAFSSTFLLPLSSEGRTSRNTTAAAPMELRDKYSLLRLSVSLLAKASVALASFELAGDSASQISTFFFRDCLFREAVAGSDSKLTDAGSEPDGTALSPSASATAEGALTKGFFIAFQTPEPSPAHQEALKIRHVCHARLGLVTIQIKQAAIPAQIQAAPDVIFDHIQVAPALVDFTADVFFPLNLSRTRALFSSFTFCSSSRRSFSFCFLSASAFSASKSRG